MTDTSTPSGGVAAIAADPEAMEAFYREHLEPIQRFVARRVSDPHLAADLTADIFVAAIDSAPRYQRSHGAPIAWLYGIARNVVATELRRQGRAGRAISHFGARRTLEPDALARIEERLDAEREQRRLYRAMDELSDDDRALLELVALDGLSVADAAKVLGVKPGTARVRLHRSRRLLRSHFDNSDAQATLVAVPTEAI